MTPSQSSRRQPARQPKSQQGPSDSLSVRSTTEPPSRTGLAFPAAFALTIGSFAFLTKNVTLQRTFVSVAVALLIWCIALWTAAARGNRPLRLEFVPRRQHWVQALTQFSLIFYWALHTPLVFAFFPFIFVQLVFAFAVDSLLTWSRRDVYVLGFGPFPIIFSINLFLLFKPEWFYWQFVLIALGFLAKEFIRWNREGRLAHIFNPSSFPLAVFSLVLLLTGTTEVTFGNFIANTIFDTPHIFLAIFLLSLPVQVLFGVARVTIGAAVTMYVIGLLYLAATGTYLFYDAYIPPAVFIGMTLLVTDPSTSPRTDAGRFTFGALYAIGTILLFILLERVHAPTFYDKLLPIPILNLMVRRIDSIARSRWLSRFAPERLAPSLTPIRRNLAITSLWAATFIGLFATRAVGDNHPGQYLPFWHTACGGGSARACSYVATLTVVFCNKGSGWACNETGILERRLGQPADASFRRACDLGFNAGCANLTRSTGDVSSLSSDHPSLRDLPIVLSGTKPPLRERDPARLYALACDQGWPGACNGGWAETTRQ
jgi:hypothetical protein